MVADRPPCVGNYVPRLAHALCFSVRPIPSVAELRDVSVVGDASFASRRPRSSAQLTPAKLRSKTDEAPPRSSCSGRKNAAAISLAPTRRAPSSRRPGAYDSRGYGRPVRCHLAGVACIAIQAAEFRGAKLRVPCNRFSDRSAVRYLGLSFEFASRDGSAVAKISGREALYSGHPGRAPIRQDPGGSLATFGALRRCGPGLFDLDGCVASQPASLYRLSYASNVGEPRAKRDISPSARAFYFPHFFIKGNPTSLRSHCRDMRGATWAASRTADKSIRS
ncbi:hypothetical protein MTO96_029713 [Rhipicephalus appendiculatus]